MSKWARGRKSKCKVRIRRVRETQGENVRAKDKEWEKEKCNEHSERERAWKSKAEKRGWKSELKGEKKQVDRAQRASEKTEAERGWERETLEWTSHMLWNNSWSSNLSRCGLCTFVHLHLFLDIFHQVFFLNVALPDLFVHGMTFAKQRFSQDLSAHDNNKPKPDFIHSWDGWSLENIAWGDGEEQRTLSTTNKHLDNTEKKATDRMY